IFSTVQVPARRIRPDPLKGLPNGVTFTFNAPSGERVTVAGDFNSWDPYMYELREYPAGVYSITIPLPPGTHQYVFFYSGKRNTDPNNPKRIYAKDGSAASLITVP
ncbi:early set domain-containing protein, partial [Treponema sp. R6D11]